ncbi:MAG: DNA-processing protein DprA [Acidimicrobiales bacterium]
MNAALVARWQAAARTVDAEAALARHRSSGIEVLVPGDPHWPFSSDPEPPSVLYVWGNPGSLHGRPRAAIVGTRRCTDLGRGIANDLGAELATAGVDVVSGLALGIDGAAHAGTVGACRVLTHQGAPCGLPIAVVANGLDRVSPRFHRALTEQVASLGAVVSESPLGTNGDRWRFPARNRLIAGLSDVVIVVESHAKGGALITVDEAIERQVPVMAVPGSIRSAASSGTNRLLVDGAVPLCSVADALAVLGVGTQSSSQGVLFDDASSVDTGTSGHSGSASDTPLQRSLLAELAVGSMSIDRLVAVSGHGLAEVMMAIQHLAVAGRVGQVGSTVSLSSEARRTPG